MCIRDRESARVKLIDTLSNYKGVQKATIIVVFDAYLVKGNPGSVSKYHNIYVVYTKEAETADHYIERVVTSMPKHYRVRVATTDGLEQIIISGQGAVRMSAKELHNQVHQAETELRRQYIENRPPKNNMLCLLYTSSICLWMYPALTGKAMKVRKSTLRQISLQF